MAKNINSNLEEKLNKFIGKSVIITQDGFLKNKFKSNIQHRNKWKGY